MPLFLISIHRPHGFDHARQITPDIRKDIDTVNEAMLAEGVRVFVGGLRPVTEAHTLRLTPDGTTNHTPGACLRADSYVDGFWILKVADLAAALRWGQRAALACRGDVEVRPFYG